MKGQTPVLRSVISEPSTLLLVWRSGVDYTDESQTLSMRRPKNTRKGVERNMYPPLTISVRPYRVELGSALKMGIG